MARLTVGSDNWGVALVFNDKRIIASMPFIIKKRFIFKLSTMPILTPFLGPWIASSKAKYSKKLGKEKEILTELIRQIPETDFFLQNWDHRYTNWLPFYWRGYQQTTNYTYVISNLFFRRYLVRFQDKVRWEINKAKNKYDLRLLENQRLTNSFMSDKIYSRKNIKFSMKLW